MSTPKERAYAILNRALRVHVNNTLTQRYGSNWQQHQEVTGRVGAQCAELYHRSPLKLLHDLWDLGFASTVLNRTDIATLLQHGGPLSEWDLNLMLQILSGIAAHDELAELKLACAAQEANPLAGIAMLGGAAAAGSLVTSDPGNEGESVKNASSVNTHNISGHEAISVGEMSGINPLCSGNVANEGDNRAVGDASVDNISNTNNSDSNNSTSANSRTANSSTCINSNNNSNSNSRNKYTEEPVEWECSDSTDDCEQDNPFICPITLQVMEDPVITPQGITFERKAIMDWIEKKHTCPLTNKPLTADMLITCYTLRNAIAEYNKLKDAQHCKRGNSTKRHSSATSIATTTTTTTSLQRNPPTLRIAVANNISHDVEVWNTTKICSTDRCADYPEGSRYIVFPESANFFIDRCTGYIQIENRGDNPVTLFSRERGTVPGWSTVSNPSNVGARVVGSYVLQPHTKQGFDFKGFYCIEIPYNDIKMHDIDLLVYGFANKGGGKGNWLKMADG
jgi:hypothetical protein